MMNEDKKPTAEKTPLHGGFMDELKGLFTGRSKPVTLGERIEQLESQAEIEEDRTKLIKRGIAAKGRINKALADRRELSGGTQQKRFSNTQWVIMGIGAVILIIILAAAIKC